MNNKDTKKILKPFSSHNPLLSKMLSEQLDPAKISTEFGQLLERSGVQALISSPNTAKAIVDDTPVYITRYKDYRICWALLPDNESTESNEIVYLLGIYPSKLHSKYTPIINYRIHHLLQLYNKHKTDSRT